MVAAMRARHSLRAPEPKILHDNVALPLSGLGSVEAVDAFIEGVISKFAELSDRETAEIFVRRSSDAVCMRSRLLEERLAATRQKGLQQLVILGAGLDSTAYRCHDLIEGLDIFEVDHPDTQGWKQERLKESGIEIPGNLKFVTFDFEHETLAEALTKGGVREDAMTLFSWLGVHMYLTDEAVKNTLNVLGRFAIGSEIVMDFVMPDYSHQDGLIPDSVAQLSKVVSQMGEPFRSLYTEEDLEARLRDAGFTEVTFYTAKILVDQFLGGDKSAYEMPDEATSLLSAQI